MPAEFSQAFFCHLNPVVILLSAKSFFRTRKSHCIQSYNNLGEVTYM